MTRPSHAIDSKWTRPLVIKIVLLQTFALIGILSAQETQDAPAPPEVTPLETASLALGHQEGKRALLKQMSPDDIDTAAVLEGFLKGLRGDQLEISTEEILEAMTALQARIIAREQKTAKTNKRAEVGFLEENATAKNVIQSDNGLQYRIVERGKGNPFGLEALMGREILVYYRGTLPDGREFTKISYGYSAFFSSLALGAKFLIFSWKPPFSPEPRRRSTRSRYSSGNASLSISLS